MRFAQVVGLTACLFASAACINDGGPAPEPEVHPIRPMAQRSMKLSRGQSVPLLVTIDRTRWPGPVTVSVAALPDGVSADIESKEVAGAESTIFVLTAAPDADLETGHEMAVGIEDANGHTVSQTVRVIVTN